MTAPHDAQGISALPRSILRPQPSQMMAVAPGSALNSGGFFRLAFEQAHDRLAP